jgi:hypothetical protein
MKKTFLTSTLTVLAVLAMSLAVAGCEQSGGFDITENLASIDGPRNLAVYKGADGKQAVTKGAVVLTWDLVVDTEGYEIWRKTGDKPFAVVGQVSPYQNWFADTISKNNLLADNTKYTYRVIAVSSASTRSAVVQSGYSEVTLTTLAGQFPAAGAAVVTAPANVNVVVQPNGKAQVSWDADPNPAVEYFIAKNSDTAEHVGNFAYNAKDYNYVGTDNIINVALYAVVGDGFYYPPSAFTYASVANTVKVLSSFNISTFNATRTVSGSHDTATEVTLTFTNVGDAGYTYVIQRQKRDVNHSVANAAWVDVSTADKVLVNNGNWTVKDTVPVTESWQYRLVVQTATGVILANSTPSVSIIENPNTVILSSLSVSSHQTRVNTVPATGFDYDDSAYDFNIKFVTEEGASYAVYYRTRGDASGSTYDGTLLGDWVLINDYKAIAGIDGLKSINWTPEAATETPKYHQKYDFKVVGTKTGKYSNEDSYTNISRQALAYASVSSSYFELVSPGDGTKNTDRAYYRVTWSGRPRSGETVKVYSHVDPAYYPVPPTSPVQPGSSTDTTATEAVYLTTGPTVADWYVILSAYAIIDTYEVIVK